MGAGDVLAQMTLEKKNIQSLELKRTATFTAIGVFYIVRTEIFSSIKIMRLFLIEQFEINFCVFCVRAQGCGCGTAPCSGYSAPVGSRSRC